MQIDCLSGSPAAVWKVAGQLDTVTAPEFRIALDRIDCARLTELTLDFEELSYISSAGLRELLILKKRMSGKPLRIQNVRSEVAEVFEITGFSSLLDYTLTARSDDYTRMSFKAFLAHKVRFGTQQPILEAEGRSYTWADVERYSQIIAGDLQKLGVSRGTHVGICGQNSPNWIFTFYAVQKLGGIALLLNSSLTPAELIRFAKVGDITHLCYGELPAMGNEAAFTDRITGADSPIRTVLSIQRGRFDERLGEYEQLCGRFVLRVEADDPCAMIFTSGSTGTPKGVLFSAYNIQNSAHACISKMNLTPEDRVCQFLPMFHIFGLSVGLIGSGIMDARIIIPEGNRTGTLIRVIQDRRCTVFHAVPTMLLAIMNHPEFEPARLSTLRVTMLAGAPVSMTQMRRFRETFPNDHFLAAYGLSEMAPVSATDYTSAFGKRTANARAKESLSSCPNLMTPLFMR